MKKASVGTIVFQLLLCAVLNTGAVRGQTAPQSVDPTVLEPARPVERQIAGGELHTFRINLAAGQFVRAEVEPSPGFTLFVSLLAPDGKPLREMDGKGGHLWRATVSRAAATGGPHLLRVRAYGAKGYAGTYKVRLAGPRAALPADERWAEAEAALAEGRRLFERGGQESEAAKQFTAAAEGWRALGDKTWEGVALTNLGWAQIKSARPDEALGSFRRALELFRLAGDRMGEGKALNGLGGVHFALGQHEPALAHYEQTLSIRREMGDRFGEAGVLSNIGLIYKDRKQVETARRYFEESLQVSRARGDRYGEFDTLFKVIGLDADAGRLDDAKQNLQLALGIARELNEPKDVRAALHLRGIFNLLYLNQSELAREAFEEAAAIDRQRGNGAGEAELGIYLGRIHKEAARPEQAREAFARSLAVRKELGDRRGEAEALTELASLDLDGLKDCKAGRALLDEALAAARGSGDKEAEASVLNKLTTAHLCLGETEKVIEYAERGLALKRELKDDAGQISFLQTIARGFSSSGRSEKAREYWERSLPLARAAKQRFNESTALAGIASSYVSARQIEKSRDLYEQAVAISREIKQAALTGINLGALANVYAELKEEQKARDSYEEALKIFRETKDVQGETHTLQNLGSFYAKLHHLDEAEAHFRQALALAREHRNTYYELFTLDSLGDLHGQRKQYERALEYYGQTLALARQTNNVFYETSVLISLGLTYANLYDFDRARPYLEEAAAKAAKANHPGSETLAHAALGNVYMSLNLYAKARDSYERSLVISREIRLKFMESATHGGVGSVYAELSQHERARGIYEESLAMMKEAVNRAGEGGTHNQLGHVYFGLGQYAKAKEHYERALAIAREVRSAPSEANALVSLGGAYLKLKRPVPARAHYEQGLALARAVRDRAIESAALQGLGDLSREAKQHARARQFYEQALAIAREIGNRNREGRILWGLMDTARAQGEPRLAAFYGKQAVNAFQSIRSDLGGFDKESQLSFVKDKEQAYRTLADLLIGEGRLPEAQIVLDLLKVEEYRSVVRTGPEPVTVPYAGAEAEALAKVEELATLIRRRVELERLRGEKRLLTAEEEKELKAARDQAEVASGALRKALNDLNAAEETVREKIKEFQSERNLQSTLAYLRDEPGTGAVAIYTLIGTELEAGGGAGKTRSKFGWAVLVTPEGRKAYPIDTRGLEQTVYRFREALGSDAHDPRPLAEQLYRAVFRQTSARQKRTLEQDLREVLDRHHDKTIMWSLDGVLRYVPMAALHDGECYLVERYRHVVFTGQSLGRLRERDAGSWRVLGLGVSERRETFAPLPGAEREIRELVRQGNSDGLFDGAIRLNADFRKEEAIQLWRDSEYPVIHIASHFSFDPLDKTASFLLTGDGRLTFADIEDKDNLFGKVDLLTLSACDTAMSANGKESEGFPILAQSLGAKSVLASLWKVSDAGTPELMTRFYRLRAADPSLPKGEAFRRAQLSLLHGAASPVAEPAPARGTKLAGAPAGPGLLPFAKDPRRPYAHPHYWASFVLVGNWR